MKTLLSFILISSFFVVSTQAQLVYKSTQAKKITDSRTEVTGTEANYMFSESYSEAKLLNYKEVCKQIVYPSIAFKAGFEGLVQVRVNVDKSGKITDYVIHGDHDLLNKEVTKHIQKLSFEPASLNGRAIDSWKSVKFRFTIRG